MVKPMPGGSAGTAHAESGHAQQGEGKELFHGVRVSQKAEANGPGHRPGGGRAPMIHGNYTRRFGRVWRVRPIFLCEGDARAAHGRHKKRKRQSGQTRRRNLEQRQIAFFEKANERRIFHRSVGVCQHARN